MIKKVVYVEPIDYFPLETRKKFKLGEFAEEDAEVEFTEELLEEHNYIVLYFDNSVDWLQAKTLFGIKKVKDSNTSEKLMNKGVGKVLKGVEALKTLLGNNF